MRDWLRKATETVTRRAYFHLHLISDSTGETLATTARAVAAQYRSWRAVEHVTPMVRARAELDRAISGIEDQPGIVLFTLVDRDLVRHLETRCRALDVPVVDLLRPATRAFDAWLGEERSGRAGAQHVVDDDYLARLEAMRFAMTYDDGNLPPDFEEADVVLVGISRTSKTPTSIYLGQRGVKCANIPLVPDVPLPPALFEAHHPLTVALVATVQRIVQVRENRLLAFERGTMNDPSYTDRAGVQEEIANTRRLARENGWPVIDVTSRSVEETAAAILALRRAGP